MQIKREYLGELRSRAEAVSRLQSSWIWALRWGTVACPFVLTACLPAVFDPQRLVGHASKVLPIESVAIILVIAVSTICTTPAFAWWFREPNSKARCLPDWAYSGRIELVTWGIPLLTITLLGGVAWIGSHELDPARPLRSRAGAAPFEVQVVSLDWKWLFIYPGQQVASVNELVIPAGTPVHFSLTSASVMNAFFVPQLGSMIYTMNGMASDLNLQADQPGTFYGISAHFSGDGFSDMHFEVHALDDVGFAAWVAAARQDGPALDDASYADLAKQNIRVSPYIYSSVDPALFQKVVSQQLAPGPGPDPEPSPRMKPVSAANAPAGSTVITSAAARTAQIDAAICITEER